MSVIARLSPKRNRQSKSCKGCYPNYRVFEQPQPPDASHPALSASGGVSLRCPDERRILDQCLPESRPRELANRRLAALLVFADGGQECRHVADALQVPANEEVAAQER